MDLDVFYATDNDDDGAHALQAPESDAFGSAARRRRLSASDGAEWFASLGEASEGLSSERNQETPAEGGPCSDGAHRDDDGRGVEATDVADVPGGASRVDPTVQDPSSETQESPPAASCDVRSAAAVGDAAEPPVSTPTYEAPLTDVFATDGVGMGGLGVVEHLQVEDLVVEVDAEREMLVKVKTLARQQLHRLQVEAVILKDMLAGTSTSSGSSRRNMNCNLVSETEMEERAATNLNVTAAADILAERDLVNATPLDNLVTSTTSSNRSCSYNVYNSAFPGSSGVATDEDPLVGSNPSDAVVVDNPLEPGQEDGDAMVDTDVGRALLSEALADLSEIESSDMESSDDDDVLRDRGIVPHEQNTNNPVSIIDFNMDMGNH